MSKTRAIQYISILLVLFCLRVLAQLVQLNNNLPFLPGFEAWHSDTLPYRWLLFFQVIIIFLVVGVITRIYRNQYQPNEIRSRWLLSLGGIYFAFMLVRFILSISLLQYHPWFGTTLPAFFHMVLASIILILGMYEHSTSNKHRT